ncbi:MAG: hypothetical protein JWO13_48 [Acidobacteriales bacterium]|nr:hypothetical protein [Terriglobales bacterium]
MFWSWGGYALATLVAAVVSSITDWFFFGVLFHDKYLAHPEVWRKKAGDSEAKSILLSTILGTFSCAAFIMLCAGLRFNEYSEAFKLAIMIWLVGALPIVLTTQVFIKLHPALAVTHSLGYFARLLISAVSYVFFVNRHH